MKKIALSVAACLLASCATSTPDPEPTLSAERQQVLTRFAPKPTGIERTIDYEVVDEFLDLTVIDLGPSTRRREQPPRPPMGTRFTQGHDSPLRLEGNKVAFSEFNSYSTKAVREYADSLEFIANRMAIEDLPKNEQLAFWFNLHNVTLMAVLAERYPVYEPSRLRIDGVPLHDAKLLEIDGVALSLREIREGIVYAHWRDPRVIYGFWLGDLGSPNIREEAWTAANLDRNLTANADEFVNSLRGVDAVGRRQLGVSPIYESAKSTLFRNWPTDLVWHLKRHAQPEVSGLLSENRSVVLLPYETRIADLSGGEPYPGPRPGIEALTGRTFDNGSPARQRMLRELTFKFGDPNYWRNRRATVTIVDGEDGENGSGEGTEID